MENYQIHNILIATAKRRNSSENMDNVLFNVLLSSLDPVFREIHEESRKRYFSSQEGRYDKHGKLPMNMIMSQTARRDKNSQAVDEFCINESAPNFEGVLSSYRCSNEKVKPWANKTKKVCTAPTVVDVIQSKYYQLYRNNYPGMIRLSKDDESGDLIKQEDPLEASEFPKLVDRKKSSLHVKWEDESPMGFMQSSKSDMIHKENCGNTSAFNEEINSKKQNEIPPTEHIKFRFLEPYNEKDLIKNCNTPEKIIVDDSCLFGAVKTEKKFPAAGEERSTFLFQKNQYFSENCFLNSVTDSVKGGASTEILRWNDSSIDYSITNEFNVPENESNLQLTCELFDPKNDSEFPLTCDLFEVPNLDKETSRLDEQNDSECSIYESPPPRKEDKLQCSNLFDGDSFFCFQKVTSKSIQDRKGPLIYNESPNVSAKDIHPKVYLSDPDDLLKTPKKSKIKKLSEKFPVVARRKKIILQD